jgi:excinuclease ABC subunit C
LLQRIRDEAHRFAISGQRASRSRSISTQLVELPGVGEKRARILLRRFGSVRRLREASVAEIADLPGFSEDSAKRLLDALAKLSAPTGATNSPNSD